MTTYNYSLLHHNSGLHAKEVEEGKVGQILAQIMKKINSIDFSHLVIS